MLITELDAVVSMEEKKAERRAHAAKARKSSAGREASPAKKSYASSIPYIIVAVVAVVVLYLIYFMATNYLSTSFPTFKSNYLSAPRVAVMVNYANATQLSYETPCYEGIIQTLSHARAAAKGWNTSTMDFFILNGTACSYQLGLGYPIDIRNATAAACLAAVKPEPTIFLNYGSSNSTIITPYKLYVYGNAAYMRSCSIMADLG